MLKNKWVIWVRFHLVESFKTMTEGATLELIKTGKAGKLSKFESRKQGMRDAVHSEVNRYWLGKFTQTGKLEKLRRFSLAEKYIISCLGMIYSGVAGMFQRWIVVVGSLLQQLDRPMPLTLSHSLLTF